jgi:polyphenol oxidase
LNNPNFQMVTRGGVSWLESMRLKQFPWLVHAFSTRLGGVSEAPCAGLNLGLTESDSRERVEQNRQLFFGALGVQDLTPASVKQVHSSHSLVVNRSAAGDLLYQPISSADSESTSTCATTGDGLITAEPGILLTIRIADCLPVLLVDPEKRVVAAVHAGWRGALARIVEKSVGDMRRAFNSDPARMIAALGPSMRVCCFEVGQEVVDAFRGSFADADRFFQPLPKRSEASVDRYTQLFLKDYPPGHAPQHVPAAHLDIIAVAQHQLTTAGMKPENIAVADYCTACRTDLFFSHRREGGSTGRLAAVVGTVESR